MSCDLIVEKEREREREREGEGGREGKGVKRIVINSNQTNGVF